MNTTTLPQAVRDALPRAWDPAAATTNMERWLNVCSREGWGACPGNPALLALLFGASWYFTRLVFFRGREAARYFDEEQRADYSAAGIYQALVTDEPGCDLEQQFDHLRPAKNEWMLRIFISYLQGSLNQEQMENALTCLADAVLQRSMDFLWTAEDRSIQDIAVLAMGRMAGGEMNFGSDLDLIFLYAGKTGSDAGELMRKIRMLLRHIASPAPSGILYEIDMRLRPHGTSGTLISPSNYFIEYHSGQREVWERQMMTRCRPVVDHQALAAQALAAITSSIYAALDAEHLRAEILRMRKKVQDELGNPKGKYEIKRGSGGIMDIDFLTHYLQLRHGHEHPELRTTSTRGALRQLSKGGFLDTRQSQELLGAYDFLKRLECALRVADMKSVSAFSIDSGDHATQRLARAMGHLDADLKSATDKFLQEYLEVTRKVRDHFSVLVGDVAG